MRTLTPRQENERKILKLMMRLPTGLLLRAFGQKPVIVDGQKLDPEMQLSLILRKLKKLPGLSDLPPTASREQLRKDALVYGVRVPGVESEDLRIPGHDGYQIPARLYQCEKTFGKKPLLVYFHGGGFVLGDIESFDHVCRFICKQTGFHVLSIDYRLAPEFPYPTGLEDCLEAFQWATKNARKLGTDSTTLGIGGDSAGANFAAIICQILAEKKETLPIVQFLIYPTCDRSKPYPSENLFGEEFFLTKKDLQYFTEHYTKHLREKAEKEGFGPKHPWISPLHGSHLAELPPAVIVTAGFDPLRDEGEAYARALNRAGTEATLLRQEGMIHGFINMIGFSSSARSALSDSLETLKKKVRKIQMEKMHG